MKKETVKETKTEAVQTAAVKAEAVKEETKAAGTETKAVKKTAPAKAAKTTKTTKAAAKSTAKAAVKETVYLQYLGKEIDKDTIIAQVKEIWTKEMKKKAADMKELTVYLKPEEMTAYYVINGDVTGQVKF